MPVDPKVKKSFTSQYGSEKGKHIMFATANKEGKGSKLYNAVHGKSASDLNWAQGFIDKCAELGIDPDELVKFAIPGPGMFSTGMGMMEGAGNFMSKIPKMLGLSMGKAERLGNAASRLSSKITPFKPTAIPDFGTPEYAAYRNTQDRTLAAYQRLRDAAASEKNQVSMNRLGAGSVGALGLMGLGKHMATQHEEAQHSIITKLHQLLGR